jgi:hypothetical protein
LTLILPPKYIPRRPLISLFSQYLTIIHHPKIYQKGPLFLTLFDYNTSSKIDTAKAFIAHNWTVILHSKYIGNGHFIYFHAKKDIKKKEKKRTVGPQTGEQPKSKS